MRGSGSRCWRACSPRRRSPGCSARGRAVLRGQLREVRTVVTAAVLVGLLAIGFRLFGNDPRTVPSLLPGAGFRLAGVVVSGNALDRCWCWRSASPLGAGLLLNRTRLGRAVAGDQRPAGDGRDARRARGTGSGGRRLGRGRRGDGGGGHRRRAHAAEQLPEPVSLLVMPAMAAALLGGLRQPGRRGRRRRADRRRRGRRPRRYPQVSEYRQVLPFVVILVCLLWSQRGEVWDAAR